MNRKQRPLTAEYVRSLLRYEPDTGKFFWLVARGTRTDFIGKEAGCHIEGYREIVIDGALYPAHRLAFLMQTGKWPKDETDHRNGIKDDNRWENLREATKSQNLCNSSARVTSKTGVKGVCKRNDRDKYVALIRYDGRQRTLGYFDTIEEAAAAYAEAARRHHGEFACL